MTQPLRSSLCTPHKMSAGSQMGEVWHDLRGEASINLKSEMGRIVNSCICGLFFFSLFHYSLSSVCKISSTC